MVGKDKIEITAELKDLLTGQLKKIQDEAAKLDNTLKNIGNGGAIGGQNTGGGMQKSMMGSFLSANLLTNAIQQGAGAVKQFAVDSVEAYQRTEGYEARLTTLLGSRKAAELDIINLRKDAAKTPFDLGSLIQGNSMLIGAGESAAGARKSILDLGNAIAATGGGSDELSRMSVNLAQIKSIGKASALDVKQFMYANIPIYDMLAKSMKKPISEIKKMDISYKDLTKALSDARQEGGMFYKGLENASNTLSGLRSNLDDTIETLKSNIGETFADTLKDSIRGLLPYMDELNASLLKSNQITKTLNKEGLGYSFMEKSMAAGQFGKLAALKNNLDTQVDRAQGGELESKQVEAGLNNYLSKISKEYAMKSNIASNTGVQGPDGKQYLREVALIKDALSSIKELRKSGKGKAEDGGDGREGKGVSSLEKVAAANRPTQVNINIENLVREYKNTFNSAAEALKMTPEQVAKVLISAVNDISNLKYT